MEKDSFLKIKNNLLKNNIVPDLFFSNDSIELCFEWIVFQPTEKLLSIRNSPHVLSNMLNKKPISIKQHKSFLDKYNDLPRLDFIIKDCKTKSIIGSLNANMIDDRIEIGKYIGNLNYLKKGIAKNGMIKFFDFFSNYFSYKYIYSRTKNKNIVNIKLNEKLGFEYLEDLDSTYILMRKKV